MYCLYRLQYKSKRVHVPKYTHFPTTGYARVLLFMFIRRELGGTGTECLFQFTHCEYIELQIHLQVRIKRGRAGGPDPPPPWKITSYMGFYRE